MGDDGEKFGGGPIPRPLLGSQWLGRAVLRGASRRSTAITTVTPSDWLAGHRPIGRIYIPTSSYLEMGEWALPADQGSAFEAALNDARAERAQPGGAGCAAGSGATSRSNTER